MLSVPGCFCTDTITAGRPSKPALPRATAGAKPTSATWREADRHPPRAAHRQVGQILDAPAAADPAHQPFLPLALQKARRAVGGKARQGRLQLVEF
jgi:hypothetical protein